jgi:hypothetical protein
MHTREQFKSTTHLLNRDTDIFVVVSNTSLKIEEKIIPFFL